jgi:hypothetical protein
MAMENTLAYYDMTTIMAANFLIVFVIDDIFEKGIVHVERINKDLINQNKSFIVQACSEEIYIEGRQDPCSLHLQNGRHDTQHNGNQRNDTQHNDIQHNNTHHNDFQHNDIQHNDIQHNDTQHNE